MFAGYRSFAIFDAVTSTPIETSVFYPALTAERQESLGPFTESIVRDGDIAPGRKALVLISHGTGSMPMLHRGLAIHLARHGFIVVLPEHPGNSRRDDRLAGTATNLRNRPRHLIAVSDWMYESDLFGLSLTPNALAIVGHSLGGYTALAVAGGRPEAFPWETENNQSCPIAVTRDHRVKALVLLAPAVAWFLAEGALADIDVPILMFTGQKDDLEIPGDKMLPDGNVVFMPAGHSSIVTRGVTDQRLVEHRVIPNAGHFSFITPYPSGMRSPAVPPSLDPAGFDRDEFYSRMCGDVLVFLRQTMRISAIGN